MAEPYKKRNTWYIPIKTLSGEWKNYATTARGISAARDIQKEWQAKIERQRKGLEPLPSATAETVEGLMLWWLDTYSIHLAAHPNNLSTISQHLCINRKDPKKTSEATRKFAQILLADLKLNQIVAFQRAKEREGLAPQTVNHLRRFLLRAWNKAVDDHRLIGTCPAKKAKPLAVPKSNRQPLEPHEVPAFLAEIKAHWRPLFATAIYAGGRKGELFAMKKSAIDWRTMEIEFASSHERDTTKGGHSDRVPIAPELVPYLREAERTSKSHLLFPRPDGTQWSRSVKLERMTAWAAARAGIITGYEHVCRVKDCGYSEMAPDDKPRKCPKPGHMKLWAKAIPRVRLFHELRHTFVTVLIQHGAEMKTVQELARHRDIRTTANIYAHVKREHLHDAVKKLSFGPAVTSAKGKGQSR